MRVVRLKPPSEQSLEELYNSLTAEGYVYMLDGLYDLSWTTPSNAASNPVARALVNEISTRLDDFCSYALYRVRKDSGNPIKWHEVLALPEWERARLPNEVILGIKDLKTKKHLQDILKNEGWEFLCLERDSDVNYPDVEIWSREVCGVIEWCKLSVHILDEPSERCWFETFFAVDPRRESHPTEGINNGAEELSRKIGGVSVKANPENGYIDQIGISQATKKSWAEFLANDDGFDFVQAVSDLSYTPERELIVSSCEGNRKLVWLHPQLAVHFAMWANIGIGHNLTSWVVEDLYLRYKGWLGRR